MMVCEQSSLGLDTSRTRKQFLRRQWGELVAYWVPRLGVGLGRIDDLEHAVIDRVGVNAGRLVDGGLADLVEIAVGVSFLVPGCGVGLLVKDGVFMAVNRGIKACVES
jgi:hypothetical protein